MGKNYVNFASNKSKSKINFKEKLEIIRKMLRDYKKYCASFRIIVGKTFWNQKKGMVGPRTLKYPCGIIVCS